MNPAAEQSAATVRTFAVLINIPRYALTWRILHIDAPHAAGAIAQAQTYLPQGEELRVAGVMPRFSGKGRGV